MTNVYCDSCKQAAGDGLAEEGFSRSGEGFMQELVLAELGADIADHLCDAIEEPDIRCDCPAHRRAKTS